MESIFRTLRTSRKLYSDFLDKYTLDQLNKVPEGFSNNLIWNIGHIIVAQQSLIYASSGLETYISDELVDLYKPGTKPSGQATECDVKEIKALLMSLVDKTEADFTQGKFVTYNERMTRTGFYLSSLTDAFEFNNYHEGIHLGYMMSIRKFV